MAWTTLSFAYGSILTSTKMTQLYDNLEAMARGESGAPLITFTGSPHGMISDFYRRFGNGELGAVVISANTAMAPGIYNFTSLTVNSGYTITLTEPGALIFRCTSAFNLYGIIDVRCMGGPAQSTGGTTGNRGFFGGAGGGESGGATQGVGGPTFKVYGADGNGGNISSYAIGALRDNPLIAISGVSSTGDILGGGSGAPNDSSGNTGGPGGGVVISISDVFDSTSFARINCNGENSNVNDPGGGAGAQVRAARVYSADVASYSVQGAQPSAGNNGGNGIAIKLILV